MFAGNGARWSTACERHGVLLKESRPSSPSGTSEGLAKEPTSSAADLPVEMGWMIQSGAALIAELESATPDERNVRDRDPQRLDRARVLRDLALLAGTRFSGGSLVELTLPIRRGPSNSRRFCWCDRLGRAIPAGEVTAPTGPLTLRQHALRVAWILWLRAYGWRYFEEARDIAMLAIVTWAASDVDVSQEISARVERWPASVRQRWRAAYEERRRLWDAA